MSKSSFPDSVRAAESWAEVRARDHVVRYRRSGLGRAVLVLIPPDHPDALWPELLDGLGGAFRLIVPEPPAAEPDAAAWLATFLEGLGVSNVGILAAGCFCIPALEAALAEADQISRIVLVPAGAGGGRPAANGVLETAIREVGVPLLVVRRAQPADDVVPLVIEFFGEQGT
jgi:hypothetical protein